MIGGLLASFVGLSAGIVISGAVFAFISVLGIIPRLADKTKTKHKLVFYEEAIIFGGIFGCIASYFDITFPFGTISVIIFCFAVGVFFGSLAISLAEVLNVIPILSRRFNIGKSLYLIILAIALGKSVGAILYYIEPHFFIL